MLGFGGAPLGDLYAPLDDATAIETVLAALDAGIRLVDTSPLYGRGLSEHRIGTALRRRSDVPVVLSTKVGRVLAPAPRGVTRSEGYAGGLPHEARFDYSYDGAMRSLEQSMLRLGVASIDIALVHDVDPWTHGDDASRRQRESLGGALRALADLRAQGAVRAIGIGVNDADVAERFVREADLDCVLLAGRYSLLEQPALDRFLPLALERGVGVMLGGVFNSGILATDTPGQGSLFDYGPADRAVVERAQEIARIAHRHGRTLPELAVQFPLRHPAVAAVVLGGANAAQLAQNSALADRPVPEEVWRELQEQGLLGTDASARQPRAREGQPVR